MLEGTKAWRASPRSMCERGLIYLHHLVRRRFTIFNVASVVGLVLLWQAGVCPSEPRCQVARSGEAEARLIMVLADQTVGKTERSGVGLLVMFWPVIQVEST
jgi:hypothetical protein